MQLHSLTLQAIGPFPGCHHIDFAELTSSGIFLLEGPTGAGKSTIIDAVVFALYGKVASEAASEDRLRSAFAAPDVESFVDLVFETASGLYRVRRTPEFQRPKKRGTGTTTQQAGVKLWRLAALPESRPGSSVDHLDGRSDTQPDTQPDEIADQPGELLSARLDEAGLELQRAIGLDRRQFVQTIVLPQGEFASFLRADPERRRDLLQKVFGTEIYERVQSQLAEMQRTARSAVAGARQAVGGAVEHFVGAAGLTIDDARPLREAAEDAARLRVAADAPRATDDASRVADDASSTEPTPSVHELALRQVDQMAAAAAALTAQELEVNTVLVAARTALEETRTLAAAAARRDVLRAERRHLDAQTPDVVTGRDRLAAARRAAVVEPVLAGARRATEELAVAREQRVLAQTGVPRALAEREVSALEVLRSEVAAAAVRLMRLLPLGASLPVRERQLVDGRKDVEREREEHLRGTAELAERPAARADLETLRGSLARTAEKLGVHQVRVLDAEAVLRAARSAEVTRTELESENTRLVTLSVEALAAVDAERTLRAARIAGIAGDLAAELSAGDPCPVCGAVEHPSPAGVGADHVTLEIVEEAELARRGTEEALSTTKQRVVALTERLDAQRRATGGANADDAATRVVLARAQVAESEGAGAACADATASLLDFDAETAALTARIAELSEHIATQTVTLDGLEREIAGDRAEIAHELTASGPLLGEAELPDPFASTGAPANPVEVLEAALRDRGLGIDALLTAESAVQGAQKAVAERQTDLGRVVTEAGFGDVQEAVDAVLDPADLTELERHISAFEAAVARVDSGLAEAAVAALPEEVEVDLDAARDVVGQAENAARTAARQTTLAVRRAEAAAEAAQKIADAIGGWSRASTQAEPVIRMANLASGGGSDNAKALSLATFVLVRRFEDVVAAANERLSEMSDGRYELARSDEREDVRTRRTGLAMKVIDHRTEASRDPRTLSGGETFYVSLCLALGMADVVTAEAGGVDLGTLFVDEGFGTLDPETLEAVLGELGKLRAGGRVVGVVSHVEALKQSIAERIAVRRLPNGASTLSVLA